MHGCMAPSCPGPVQISRVDLQVVCVPSCLCASFHFSPQHEIGVLASGLWGDVLAKHTSRYPLGTSRGARQKLFVVDEGRGQARSPKEARQDEAEVGCKRPESGRTSGATDTNLHEAPYRPDPPDTQVTDTVAKHAMCGATDDFAEWNTLASIAR